jgi:hypothetical protein
MDVRRFVIKNNIFFFLLIFAIFFPLFQSKLGSMGAIIINGSLITFISLYLFFKYKLIFYMTPLAKKYYLYYSVIWIFFLFHIALSIVIGMLFGDVTVIERDLFEFHRPILNLLIFTIVFLIFLNNSNLNDLNNMIIVVFIGIVIIGLIQFFRIDDSFSELYTSYYNIKGFRVAAPFTNPYDFAFVMTFFIYYFFIATLYKSWKYLLFFFIAVTMFVLPQSRAVAVGFLVGFFVITPIVLTIIGINVKKGILKKPYFYYLIIFSLVIISFLASIPYLLDNFEYLTGQFVRLLESGEVGNSAGARIEQFMFALEKAKNPLILLFGNGPSKLEMEYVESMYTYQFYRYGLVGVILYFVYPIILTVFLSWKLLKMVDKKSYAYVLFLTMILWLLTHPFMFIGNNFTEQVRTSFLYYSLLGIVAAQYVYYKQRILR